MAAKGKDYGRGQCVNHPERGAWSRGLCRYCYLKYWKSQQPPATCHPQRPQYHRSGLCMACYIRGLFADGGPSDWELIREKVKVTEEVQGPRQRKRDARKALRQRLPGARGAEMRAWLARQPPSSCHPNRPRYNKVSGLCASCYKGQLKGGAYYRLRNLQANYGPDAVADYIRRFEAQGGVCAICRGTGEWARSKHLAVDHDHDTGVIRGLLCSSCNRALGLLGEKPETALRAHQYLAHSLPEGDFGIAPLCLEVSK